MNHVCYGIMNVGKELVVYFERLVISCVLNCNGLSSTFKYMNFTSFPHHNHSITGDSLRIGMGETVTI